MKNFYALCVVGCVAVIANVSLAAGPSSDTEKAIATLEKQWSQSEVANNADQIAPLLADKFIVTESDGETFDRAGFLAEERSSKYSTSEVDDLKVTVFGDTAIANYVLRQKYTSKGIAHDTRARETDTWVKMPNGVWQCVAAQSTPVKKG